MHVFLYQERLLDELNMEEGEEGEVDENGVAIANKSVRHLDSCPSTAVTLTYHFCSVPQ